MVSLSGKFKDRAVTTKYHKQVQLFYEDSGMIPDL